MFRASSDRSVLRALTALVFTAAFLSVLPSSSAKALDLEHLTLAAVVETAISRNLIVEAEGYTLDSSRASLLSEEGKFDPTLKFNLSHSGGGYETPTQLDPTSDMSFKSDVSLELRSKLGSTYELRVGSEWVTNDNVFLLKDPYYDTEVALTFTRPLLRGYGEDIPTTAIRVAANSLEISKLQYDETVIAAVEGGIKAYWELFFAHADLQVARQSLELARNLLSEVRDRIRAGKLASIEVFQAEAEVAKRQEDLIRVRKAVGDSEDMLREVMNIQEWDTQIATVDEPPDPVTPVGLDLAIQSALENRKDYKRAFLDNKNKVELRKYYENQKRSQLDLFATVSSNSVDDNIKDVPWAAFPLHTSSSWSAGLNYSKPLGGGEAEGQYARAMSEEARTRVLIEVMNQRVRFEVREAWRNVNLARESVEATTVTRRAADKRWRAEEEKFRVGKATLRDVLEFQAEFASALSAEKRSRADYAIALAQLARQTGTLMDSVR